MATDSNSVRASNASDAIVREILQETPSWDEPKLEKKSQCMVG